MGPEETPLNRKQAVFQRIFMAIKMTETFKKIDSKDLIELESHIGYSLPEVYKKFLLKNNGGRIQPNGFGTINNKIESGIQFMFGITENKNYDIRTNRDSWLKNTSKMNLVPIAIDFVGNLIVLSCTSPTYESVYLWQHDSDDDLLLVATDFTGFLKGLYKIKIEESGLDQAIARQDINYFENRILKGENVDTIKNEFNQSAIVIAALYNKVRLLKYFKQKGSNLEMALFSAASRGRYEAVQYLLALGINPDERDPDQNNDTPLIQAAFGGHLDVVKELIAAGADINAMDKHEQSVVTKARWSGNTELIEYLERLGAK